MSQMLLIGNGVLITRDPANPFIEKGGLLLEDNLIKEVGDSNELKSKYPEVPYMDAEGMLIMPGYINAHHHIYSAFARGMNIPDNHPLDFLEILKGTWWKLDRTLSLQATYDSGIATYLECIQNGVTTVVDHHASYNSITKSLEALSEAAGLLGVRTCLAYEISDRDGQEKMLEAIQESFDFAEQLERSNRPSQEEDTEQQNTEEQKNIKEQQKTTKQSDGSMQRALIGLHASFTLSDETLALCRERNTKNIGYHVHVAEGAYDQEHCLKEYGCTVVERLKKQGILNEHAVAGHCIHITESDMDLLKETGTTVVHNPQSNMGNAVGAPDVLTMMDKGIPVCLGTDGYTSDMLESAKTAILLQKHRSKNPDRGFAEAAKMLFQNNAVFASGLFGTTLGVLQTGAAADVILVDYKPYTPLTKENIDGHLFFGVSGRNTDTTIINGKVLMRHKKLKADVDTLYKSCRKTSAQVWRELYE